MAKVPFRSFIADNSGNVAMMFSAMMVVLVGGVALATDASMAFKTRESLTNIADSAALSGAFVATTNKDEREDIVQKTIDFHVSNLGSHLDVEDAIIKFDDSADEVTVTLRSKQNTTFAKVFGKKDIAVKGQSVASYAMEEVNPVSMTLVVDISSSMSGSTSDGRIKIDVLKDATETLFDAIEDSAPRKDILKTKMRSGLTVYSNDMVDAHTVPMAYGWNNVESEVKSLVTLYGTNSTLAFKTAYDMLTNDPNQPADLKEYIVFMTDGANNSSLESDATRAHCEAAKADGITIFSVAFEAPSAGEALLRDCASLNDGATDPASAKTQYYFDTNNAAEFEAAFKAIGEQIGKLETRIVR
ncbi:pilus assembly protein TadG-related protein [Litorimonas sp. RW-G-Af-16]|uniref:TadE/TadG family type IV pilus assembly protein n=1 Tax=Litorimonas sp. RW-G-Af-16 TaxID=3241168 RepID=UPI00390C9677